MAELYDQNKIYANRPTASSQAPQSADAELEAMLSELPPEEREAARASITAAPTGEDINRAMQERNANGEVFNMNIEQYRLWKSNNKTKEVDVLDSMGQAAEGVFNEIMAAAGSIYDKPLESTAKLTPSIVEAFAQGTRSLYGMAAQSQDPNSVFFRVKNALSANGDDEQAEFQQFMEAQEFNVKSMKLATGKETWLVDKDLINPEMTQVMSYIADPTLFVPFGGIAAKGAKMIGMGEALAKASARASQIQRKVLGGAIKWGAGAPIEFLGTATRNTIDYGLEKAGSAFEVVTGMPVAEARTTAQMYGWYSASAALEGRTVGLPLVGNIAGAAVGSTTARGVGEALSMVGEQIGKQERYGRGVLSYAGQALRDANKSGVPLSQHAKALLNVLDKVDPLFVYSADISKGAAEGMAIGGILGGLNAGEEGAASGAGAGMMLGAVGAGMGSAVSDIGKGRLYDRIAVQRQMVIEGLRNIDADKASAFEAMAKTAELSGNRDLIAQVDGIITGIDVMAPNSKFVARTEKAHMDWLLSQKIDPDTGRLMEPLALFPEFGTDRKSRARALSFLSMIGNRFDGDHKLFIKELQGLPQDHALRKQFFRLSGEQKTAVFNAIDKAATPESKAIFGGKSGYEFYGQLNYAEANVARVNAMFDAGNKTQANEMIRTFLKDETVKGELTERGKLLKEKLATEGYFDKDGNMRPSRLKDVEATRKEYKNAKGFVFRRDSTGQVEIHINLNEFGKETAPHELFHAVMMDSMLKPDFIDRLGQNLLGKFDADGKRIENASVDVGQVKKFFQRYIDALHGKDSQEAGNQAQRLEAAIKEYEARGTTNKISLETKNTLEGLLEEFGAYYFGAFINNKPVDYLFRGGELGAMREVMGNAKQGFLDFWRSKIKSINPDFNFDPSTNEFITQAFEKDGIRTKNKSLDLMMRDFVRATAMANKQGGFDVSRLSPAARETFVKNNGIRGLSMTRDANGNLVRSSQRKVIIEQMRTGKEIYKILSGLDPKYRQGLYTDGEGNLSGRLSPEAMEAMVQSGHIDRAWVDKIQQGYNILEGKGGNVIYFGYLGRTAQIGDYAWPRLVGSDVPFKNRAAVLVGVDFKVGKDGKMYSLFHTLDKAVIDGRADVLWSDSAVRTLWGGDRGAMEADFFRYLSNASKAAGDSSRLESAVLLEDGTGAGSRRRDVLHQMLGMVKAEGDVYLNKPIAEIPYGIRHSVTTFNVDGIANMRVGTDRWNVVPENAFKDLSRNFQPSEMAREDTPNGSIIKHPLGYKFAEKNGKVRAFDKNGNSIGVFDGIEQASEAAKKYEGKLQIEREQFTEEVRQEQDKKMARFQPIEGATRRQALQPDGDLFSTDEIKAFTKETRVIKQTQQEFVAQYVQEMLLPENKSKVNELIEQSFDRFRELREIEKQLNAEREQLTWDSKSNQEELKILQGRIVELIQERQKNIDGKTNLGDNPILDFYAKQLIKQEALIKRNGEIIAELEAQGITNRSSDYWKTKTAYESYEQGKLTPEVAAVFLESQMQKVYNDQYATGVPVTFVANHGTPNYALIASKMFDVARLGENTGSASAKKATFFAGSDTTAINYIGVPLEPNWINHPDYAWYFDLDRIKRTITQNYSNPDLIIPNTEALFNEVKSRLEHHDTSKGVKNEIEKILAPLEAKSKAGERLDVSILWLERLSNHMVDVGTTFGGYGSEWKDAGRPPHLMRQLVKMTNPFVFEYKKSDFRDVTFNEVIMKATEAGHDGVVFKNARDGGVDDIIYALISNTPNEAIKVFETAHDGNAVNRGVNENGKKILNGRELGLMFQPSEGNTGGRVYDPNSKEWKFGFVGRIAEENPELTKDVSLQHIDKGNGMNKLVFTDNSSGQSKNIGHISWDKFGGISTNIDPAFRGRGLSYLFYSEAAERMRAQGIKQSVSTIVNKEAIPVKIREAIFGDTRRFISRREEGKPIGQAEAKAIIAAMQEQGGEYAGVNVSNKIDPNARYQPAEIPEGLGTSKVKDGYVRMYHQTTPENIQSIVKNGLLVSKTRASSESRGVSIADSPFYGTNNPNLVTIEVQVPRDKLKQANGSALQSDIPASDIIAVHEPWHENARYIEKNPETLKEVLNGDMDFMLGDNSPEAKAIEYIKNKHSKDKPRYQPAEGGADWSKTVAEAQRDKPESAMVRVQHKLGGGLMSTVIEQAGDILHRTYERININNGSFGYETVKYKVDLALKRISDLLLNKDEFKRNAVSNFANDKRSTGTSEQHLVEVKKLLKEFGDAHAELPANNELQRRVKALNVALGNLDFNSAHRELKFLNTKLVNENTWTNFAKEGMSKENRPAFQPAEGDRIYTQKQMDGEFVGRYASENPKATKGLKPKFEIFSTGDEGSIMLMKGKGYDEMAIGSISYSFSKATGEALIQYSSIAPAHQGKGYGNLLYSELVERLRSMGMKQVQGMIVDDNGRPQKIRERIIDQENARIGGDKTQIDYVEKDPDSDATHTGVTSYLYKDARYQPSEYQGGDDYYKKGKSKNGVKIPKQYQDWPTSPESVDEFGAKIRYLRYFDPKSGKIKEVENFPFTYMEIGHELNSKDVYLWSLNNANFKKYGVHENSPLTIENMASMMRDKKSPFHGYGNLALSDVRGRIEMPVLDDKANIIEKGRVSIGVLAGAEGKVTLPQFRLLKENIITKLGIPGLSEKDFDFWLYTADREIRSQFGLSEKDKGGIKFQPREDNQGSAWYNKAEKIGTQSSNIKLLLEGMASGRILRTSSYKGLGLEDANLIAHTPDTAKIGQVTARDKALADLQGGIFYAIANGKKVWASNFAGDGETNILVQYANDQLKTNPNKKTYILLVKPSSGDNSKIFASVDGARGVSNIFKHLNDSKVMTDLKYVEALKKSAETKLGIQGLEGLGKEELYARIDDALLNSKSNEIGFDQRREFTREIARQLDKAGAFDSKKSKNALVKSFHNGFERGFSIVEMERVFGNLMAEDVIKDVPAGHVYGALEITSPLKETPDSGHRGYDASIEQESGEPARLIMFDKTAHVTEMVNKKSGKEISIHKAGEGSYHSHVGGQIPYQEVKGKSRMPFQPSEGFSTFTSERTPTGVLLKNAAGYVISRVGSKYRVYNPYKAVIGVYDNEEQAKNRIYKEEPRR
jgi:hypothetical protein